MRAEVLRWAGPEMESAMQPAVVLSRASRPPDLVVSYGPGPDRVADVRIPAAGIVAPAGSGETLPTIVFLHGGFWRAAYDRKHAGPLAEALADSGFVVCTPEYRKVGQDGGGWPGTFDDIATAVRLLPGLVAEASHGIADPARTILAGHSAGGHLALWSACELGREHRLPGRQAVVSLAGVCDLTESYRQQLGRGAAGALMGGGPDIFPDRYAAADPMLLLPVRALVSLVHGKSDDQVPWQQSHDLAAAARAAGDTVSCSLLDDCGHFEVIDPLSSAWPAVLEAFRLAAARLSQR
jgi:acetyl esterase/lipase